MYGVCRLHSLHTLNLAHNGILTIEGLKELVLLKHLCLAGNNIKVRSFTLKKKRNNQSASYFHCFHQSDVSQLVIGCFFLCNCFNQSRRADGATDAIFLDNRTFKYECEFGACGPFGE